MPSRDAAGFSGEISGFRGNSAPDVAHSDSIDLVGINYNSSAFSETYNSSCGLLTVTDGTHVASLTFLNFDGTFDFVSDGRMVEHSSPIRPRLIAARQPRLKLAAIPSVFKAGFGADTILNFNQHSDSIQLDNFSNIQSFQQLTSLIATNAHGDAVMELGHSDSITLPGMAPSYLQAHLQSLVHLH